ncbi:MAG TPA: hypothetical protein VFW73_11695 [Lacipirellulaceae bacterium]|nr:hypothetical protein [Lacipirellulaceae bacterium]
MPSFQTMYRATVMLVVAVLVVKGWQLYGPSAEQLKSAAVNAIDVAETAWKNWQKPSGTSPQVAEARGAAPPFGSANPRKAPAAPTTLPFRLEPSAPLLSPAPAANATAVVAPTPVRPTAANCAPAFPPVEQISHEPVATGDRVPALLSRLQQLGAANPQVTPWGSSGGLYRCSCGTALADSPSFTKHFEAVATEPAAAVEQVVAKVEAWQTARRNDTALR